MIDVKIEGLPELSRTFKSMGEVLRVSFWQETENVLFAALEEKTKPYRDTGTLHRNLYSKQIDDGVEAGIKPEGMMVQWGARRINYASFILTGTRDHDIAPKNRKALRWVGSNGRFAFSKGHRVSGIKKDDFLGKAAKETMNSLQGILDKQLKQAGVY